MKKHLPAVITACISLCAGFAVCYFCLVIPHHGDKAGASMPHQQTTTITITQDGNVYLAGERLDPSQLGLRLKALGEHQPITIRADVTSDARRTIEVIEACKAASLSRISLVSVAAP